MKIKNQKKFKKFMKEHRSWNLYKNCIETTPMRTWKFALTALSKTEILEYYELICNDYEYWTDLNKLWLEYVN